MDRVLRSGFQSAIERVLGRSEYVSTNSEKYSSVMSSQEGVTSVGTKKRKMKRKSEISKKKTEKRPGVATVTEIPVDLFNAILKAVAIRKELETQPQPLDMFSKHKIELAEGKISFFAEHHKSNEDLPQDWVYDPSPAAINNLLPKKLEVDEGNFTQEEEEYQKRKNHWSCIHRCDPNRKFPKTQNVPLKKEEKKIWLEFKKFSKHTIVAGALMFGNADKQRNPIELDNPVVGVIGHFAITAFNKLIEKFVKNGEHNNIHDYDFTKCSYIKLPREYFFYMTIEAIEEGKHGVYETKVVCKRSDGRRSLSRFELIPYARKKTCKKMAMIECFQKTNRDDWCDLEDDYFSGLTKRRAGGTTYPGYDYDTPWGFDGP